MSEAETFPDPAADAGREAGQGRARRADPPAPGRIRAPPVRRGRLRPRRAGAGTSSALSSGPSSGWGPSTPCCAISSGTRSSFRSARAPGPAKGDLEWRRPTRETLQNMLRNPAYAGYYAYGRRQVDPRRKIPGRPDTGKVVKPAASGWSCCRAGFPPTSARTSTARTSPGWPPTSRPRSPRALPGTGRRCCPGCCAAACAAGTAWRSATTTRPPAPPTATPAGSTR